MMLYHDIMAELNSAEEELKSLKESGYQLAQNESEYRSALRVLILKERDKGTPVSIISDICRGDEQIAEKKRLRDCAEAIYKASQEAIQLKKLRARIMNEQLAREWSTPERI